jgi:hypothetical protein
MRAPAREEELTMVRIQIALTPDHREVLAELGPYTLRPDGVIEDCNGASLTNCRPNAGAEACEWDRALVAVLNAVAENVDV